MGTEVMHPSSIADRRAPLPSRQQTQLQPVGIELLEFAQTLCACSTRADLQRRFVASFGRLFGIRMYGLYVIDPWTGGQMRIASAGVSDTFLARYEREGREVDWLQGHLATAGHAAYNMAILESMDQWLESPLYKRVKYLHDIRHEVQAPVVNRDGFVGTLYLGVSDVNRAFTPYEVRLMEALGKLVGALVEGLDSATRLERQRDQAVVALERSGAAVVITDSADPEPQLNEAARRLLAGVVDAEQSLHRMIARPGGEGSFSRHLDVELIDGGTGLLRGYSSHTRPKGDVLITVLELQRDRSEIPAETLMALTPREREVAKCVVDGLSDREIAERLFLSHHTVSQYVKRIYRKLDVPSRVALTRLLLGARDRP